MTPTSAQILQEAFENPNCDGCWGRLQALIEELEAKANNEIHTKTIPMAQTTNNT